MSAACGRLGKISTSTLMPSVQIYCTGLMLDDIINDETTLRSNTTTTKNLNISRKFEEEIKKPDDASLFRNNEKRSKEPPAIVATYPRHALFMALLHFKDNPTH